MLWYKAWHESRTRFLLCAITIAALCAAFVIFHREGTTKIEVPTTYTEYIWKIVYKTFLRELFVLLALFLGVGGLLRERELGTAGFTLALPASRSRIVAMRAVVGLAQIALISLLPVLVIPALSSVVGEHYPFIQALKFAALWTAGGAVMFMMGFLASTIFEGEYTAPVAALLGMLAYSLTADLPFLENHVIDIHDMMSGSEMSFFDSHGAKFVGPLPWNALAVIMVVVISTVAVAGRITQRQNF
jgi:ABC-2 type transport system permease protein